MEMKKYISVQVEVVDTLGNDIVTLSAGAYDSGADNDVNGGDIFND